MMTKAEFLEELLKINPKYDTDFVGKAFETGKTLHDGQLRKSGEPYFIHPIEVALILARLGMDEETIIGGLLHDVVEDTSVTLEELAVHFPSEVVDAVALLTHSSDMPYLEYVRQIKDNPIARVVKLADLYHNCDATRLPGGTMDEGVIRRYENKYKKALEILE